MSELLPCPFCGESDAERGYNEARWPIIKCMNCGAQGPCISSDEAKAEENWNRRAPIKSLEAAQDAAVQDEITQRITEYLAHGGLINPELMDHEKVRDLLIGCRAKLALYRAGQGYCYITNEEYERLKGIEKLGNQLIYELDVSGNVQEAAEQLETALNARRGEEGGR